MSSIRTYDIFWDVTKNVGSVGHCALIDLLAATRGPEDEKVLQFIRNGATQQDVAEIMGVGQQRVSERYRGLIRRANKCNGPRCGCRGQAAL